MAVRDVIFDTKINVKVEQEKLAQASRELVKLESTLASAKKGSVEYETALRRLTNLQGQFGASAKVAQGGAAGFIGSISRGIATLGVFAATAKLVGESFTAALDSEQIGIAFETIIGDAERAKKLQEEIAEFAASTPFEIPELNNASRSLLAFGISAEKIIPTLKRIGDISSGVGQPVGEIAELYGKARVQGRLFAEDINQLTGRGIPIIQELAKQFGVSDSEVKKLVEDGKVGFDQLEKAFISLTSEGGKFAGLTEKQSQSIRGLLSTVKDNVIQTGKSVVEFFLPALRFLINNFNLIVKTVGSVVAGFLAYRGVIIVTRAVVASYTVVTQALVIAKAFLEGGVTRAAAALRLFNITAKASPIGVIIGLVTLATTAWLAFRNGIGDVNAEQNKLNESLENSKRILSGFNKITVDAGNLGKFNRDQTKQFISDIEQQNSALNEQEKLVFAINQRVSSKLPLTKRKEIQKTLAGITQDEINAQRKLLAAQKKAAEERLQDLPDPGNKPVKDDPIVGSIGALRKAVDEEFKKLNEKTKVGSEAFFTRFKEYQKKKQQLAEAEKLLEEQFPKDSLKFLNDQVSKLKKELDELSQTDPKFKEITEKLAKAQQEANKASEAADPLGTKLARLKSEEQFENSLLQIRGGTSIAQLDLQKKFAEDELQIIKEKYGEQSREYEALVNKLAELDARRVEEVQKVRQELEDEEVRHRLALLDIEKETADPGRQKEIEEEKFQIAVEAKEKQVEELRAKDTEYSNDFEKAQNELVEMKKKRDAEIVASEKERNEKLKESVKELAATIKEASSQIIQSEIEETDAKISEQQRRVSKAAEIAGEGNAMLLKEEEKRLNELNRQREKFVRAQQALAVVELVANSAIAISKSAANPFPYNLIAIASTVAGLAAGLSAARAKARSAAYYKGGTHEYSDESGYTGDGSPYSESTMLGHKQYKYHKREYIMSHVATSVGRNRHWLEFFDKNRIDIGGFIQKAQRYKQIQAQNASLGITKQEMKELLKEHAASMPKPSISIDKDGIRSSYESSLFTHQQIHSRT